MRFAKKPPSPFTSQIGGADRPRPSPGSPRGGYIPKAAIAYALSTIVWVAAAPDVGYADEQWQLGITPSFSSGKYGTDTRTDIIYTPFTARRLFTDGDVSVVLPYTCIRGSGDVTIVDGIPVRTDLSSDTRGPGTDADVQREGPTGGRSDRAGAGSDSAHTTDELPTTHGSGGLVQDVSTCGLGDIIVRGRYYVMDERGWLPTVAIRAHLKVPTASADTGLGTGRPDEGVGVEVSRMIGGGFMAMVDGGYTVIGKPDGVEFNNRWWYDVGIAKSLASGAANVSVFFEEYRTIVPGFENPRDVVAMLSLKGASGWRVQLLGEFGLSNGAPDVGLIIGARRRF